MSQPKKMSPVVQKWLDAVLAQSQTLNEQATQTPFTVKRAAAQNYLRQMGLPTRRDEAWQYTPLTALVRQVFELPQSHQDMNAIDISAWLPDFNVFPIVLLDGVWQPQFTPDLPKGFRIESVQDTESVLGNTPFEQLNDVLFTQCLRIEVEKHAYNEWPLFIVHLQTQSAVVNTTRLEITVGEQAQLTWMERFVSLAGVEAGLVNLATRIQLAPHAVARQVLLQQMALDGFYFANQRIQQAEHAHFQTLYVGLGSQLSRQQNYLNLQGEHAEAQQHSIVLGSGKQLLDSRTDTRHEQANCQSNQLHKYVLTDQAKGVFDGMIYVAQDAQKTDGQMDNRNLLLSDEARIDGKPQLEIYADDVKCSHGCATGQMDDEQVFYLQARGINKRDAQRLITQAFLLEPLDDITHPDIRRWLTTLVKQQLSLI